MNDDHVIDLLRSAGTKDGAADLGPAMRQGNGIRRRRRLARAAGGGAGVASIIALGLFVTGMNGPSESVVVAPPAASSTPAARPAKVGTWEGTPRTWEQGLEVNYRLLEETFGPDFKRATEGGQIQVRLKGSTATAQRLPDGYEAFGSLDVVQAGLLVGFSPGEKYRLPDGRSVDLYRPDVSARRDSKMSPETLKIRGVRDGVGAMFTRDDGSRIRVFLTTKDKVENSTDERRASAVEFLNSYVDPVANLAADPRIFPNDGEDYLTTPATPTRKQINQRYLQEALGDAWGTKVDSENRITLKPGSDLARKLPTPDYQGKATLTILNRAQFQAACNAKPGLAPCETRTLPDGRTVRWRSFADRDATDATLLGESAVYLERENGTVVMAMVAVLGRNVSAADRDAHRAAVLQWFDSLRQQLIAAATDERVGADSYVQE